MKSGLTSRLQSSIRALLAPLDEIAALVPVGASVLELGCGQGLLLSALEARAGRLMGVDYDPRKARIARDLLGDRATIQEADIVDVLHGTAAGTFDCLILSDTLSSFPPDRQADVLRLAASRLGTRGRLVVSFIDADAYIKSAVAWGISRVVYGARLSKSAGQRFTYRGARELRAILESTGLVVSQRTLHLLPPRLIPHVALIATRPSTQVPDVTFAVLNLRVGGQVSGLVALGDQLQSRGTQVTWALPEGVGSTHKPELDRFARLPFRTRRKRTWRALRGLRPVSESSVLQLVLPSPAFAVLASAVPWPEEQVIVQYEGPATRLNGELFRAMMRDPLLIAPRLILNNHRWARLARRMRVTHLASHPTIGQQLSRLALERTAVIPNCAVVDRSEGVEETPTLARDSNELWIAYIGHCHPVKGVDLLVRAFERAAVRRPELRLLLALTRDGRSDAIRRRVEKSHARNSVQLGGLVNVAAVLSSIDALVLPYRTALTTTLYPSLLLEANEARCPVIVSRIPELMPILHWSSPALRVVTPNDVLELESTLVQTTRRTPTDWLPIIDTPNRSAVADSFSDLYSIVLG